MAKINLVTFARVKQIIGIKQKEMESNTIQNLLDNLVFEYGDILRQELFDDSGKLRKHYRVVINGRHINLLDGFQTVLKDNDTVVIMPAMAGG